MIIRKATTKDKDIVLKWRNDLETRNNSFNTKEISTENHEKWFRKKLESKPTIMFIAEDNEPLAFVRIERDNDQAEIHVNVNPEKRGKGIGKESVRLASQEEFKHGTKEIIAKIKPENKNSIKLFKDLGFNQSNENDIVIMKKKPIYAIVQARIRSTRLPGKVLMKLDDKTVLEHVIEQLKKSNKIDKIIIATSNKEQNNEIETTANEINIETFRGDEDNVMKRYLDTAEKFNIQDDNLIIRITADCPLVNETILNEMLDSHKDVDYTYNNVSKSMVPRGFDVEIFTLENLKKAYQKVDKLPEDKKKFYQEHVSKYLADNPDSYKHNLFTPCHELKRPDLNFSIDTKEDFERVKKVIKEVKELTPKNIVKLFPKPKITIYTVSTPEIGTGHLKRMITIADIINKEINCSVTFIVNDEKENKDLLKDYDFKAVNITKDNAKEFIDKDADVHIVDILGVTEKFNDNMIIIDTHMDKKDKIIIKSDFKRREKINKQVENILVSMGGSDPDNTTEIITKSLENTDKSITIVLGPMFKHKDKIKNIATKNMTILENIKDMKTLMENADIGIASAGATLFEMISTGLPCISIAVSEQQISNTTNAGKDGYAIDIGRKPTIEKILETINKLESYETRKSIYEKQAQYKPDTEEIINEIITCLIP